MNIKEIFKDGGKGGEVIRFALVGGLCTLLQYGIYVVFVHAVGVTAVVSTLISYAISFIVNFIPVFLHFTVRPMRKKDLRLLQVIL